MPTITGKNILPAKRDADGNRVYQASFEIELEDGEGPFSVFNLADLPQPGDAWDGLGGADEGDDNATCKQEMDVKYKEEKDKRYALATLTWSTKGDEKRCKDEQIEDPLLVPAEIEGDGCRFAEEGQRDRFGNPIQNSAFEPIRGPNNEWDATRHTVRVKFNSPVLGIEVWGPMEDTVNDAPLWGLPARCWKLAPVKWARKFWGACEVYYPLEFEFEARVITPPDKFSLQLALADNLGTGYLVGDLITIAGGTFDVPATLVVTEIDSSNGVLAVEIVSPGVYSVVPTNPVGQDFTSGVGGGATFLCLFGGAVLSGWDRDLLDEGTKVLCGRWDENGAWQDVPIGTDFGSPIMPDPDNPADFIQFQDRQGNVTRVVLNGEGRPANSSFGTGTGNTGEPGNIHVEKYYESDFLALGIPLVL